MISEDINIYYNNMYFSGLKKNSTEVNCNDACCLLTVII